MFKEADCKMEARTGIAITLLLVGCTQPQVSDENSEPIVAVSPTVAPRPVPQQGKAPRRLKVRLTLDRPEDLKVKVQDSVVKGQVISDSRRLVGDHRTSVRASLVKEQEALRLQLRELQVQALTPSYAVEQAEVEKVQLKVEQARDLIAYFHSDSPWTDYARQVLPLTDSDELGKLEAGYREAKGELAIAVAKLQTAQQQNSLKLDSSIQQAKILSKIQEVNGKLNSVGVVRSPYSGQIKAVKWLGQTDQELQVELSITIAQSGRAFGEQPTQSLNNPPFNH